MADQDGVSSGSTKVLASQIHSMWPSPYAVYTPNGWDGTKPDHPSPPRIGGGFFIRSCPNNQLFSIEMGTMLLSSDKIGGRFS